MVDTVFVDSSTRSAAAWFNDINSLFYTLLSAPVSLTALQTTVLANYLTTGDVKLTLKTVADTGWVLMNDTTIGNAASGATGRANADTSALFTLLWNNTANGDCAVSTGRGANAAADYAANKTIALPKVLGRALAAYGSGSGLTGRALALATGFETHTLSTGEMPGHQHGPTAGAGFVGTDTTTGLADTAGPYYRTTAQGGLTTSVGGGGAHNNMQPTVFLNTMIKL